MSYLITYTWQLEDLHLTFLGYTQLLRLVKHWVISV